MERYLPLDKKILINKVDESRDKLFKLKLEFKEDFFYGFMDINGFKIVKIPKDKNRKKIGKIKPLFLFRDDLIDLLYRSKYHFPENIQINNSTDSSRIAYHLKWNEIYNTYKINKE